MPQQNRTVYDFKSVGERVSPYRQNNRLDDEVINPIGIKTPVQLGGEKEGFLAMHYNLKDTIQDNLKNLILTNHGERLGNYYFGANLKELLTELGSEDGDIEAISRIKAAIKRYMPFVEPQTFETGRLALLTTQDLTAISIKITYSIPNLRVTNQGLEVIMYMAA
jgi:phage baseplate assembly protein W